MDKRLKAAGGIKTVQSVMGCPIIKNIRNNPMTRPSYSEDTQMRIADIALGLTVLNVPRLLSQRKLISLRLRVGTS